MRATFREFEKWRKLPEAIGKWLSWKWCMHAYQVSSPCVVPLGSLRSEEVIKRSAWGYLLLWSSWKRCNTHVHQISPPCVLQLSSLRSEEVILKNNIRSSWKHVIITYQVSSHVCYLKKYKSALDYLVLFTNMYCCFFGDSIHYVYKVNNDVSSKTSLFRWQISTLSYEMNKTPYHSPITKYGST